jgi:hypothetical protein
VFEPSRRLFLSTAAAVMASPTVAIASSDDRDLFGLCAEIIRLRGEADVIEAKRVWPHDDEVELILSSGDGTRRERIDAAEAFSIRSGHREAGNEVSRLLARADVLMERVLAMPATTAAARRAKVETLLAHLDDEGWRQSDDDAGWEFRAVRSLLREMAAGAVTS